LIAQGTGPFGQWFSLLLDNG